MPRRNRSEVPMRRCIGCMRSRPKAELMRFTFRDGRLKPDPAGTEDGRGVYLCPNDECRRLAVKRNAFRRNFRTNIDQDEIDRALEEMKNHE